MKRWERQVIQAPFMVVGWVLLIPFCFARAWGRHRISTKPLPGRYVVDAWSWQWMNTIYGNPEDGVSGSDAMIWHWDGEHNFLGPYMPDAWAPWRAYCWSAWRNSTNALSRKLGD